MQKVNIIGDTVLVSLGRLGDKGIAVLDRADFKLLCCELGVSPNWNVSPDGTVIIGTKNKNLTIARLLMDAGPEQQVTYADGNKRNLTGRNLGLMPGYATRRDRSLLTPLSSIRRPQSYYDLIQTI
jgi:hypothetical protein